MYSFLALYFWSFDGEIFGDSEKFARLHLQPAEKKEKKRAQRATSNVFAMFEQSQIQEFKEAFQMMDQDKDGFISKDDLRDTYASLGVAPKEATLDEMLNEAPGPINFTMFITLFGDKVSG